jgi:hypothetical protein
LFINIRILFVIARFIKPGTYGMASDGKRIQQVRYITWPVGQYVAYPKRPSSFQMVTPDGKKY